MHLKLLQHLAFIALFTFTALSTNAQSGTQVNYFVPQPFPRSPSATALEKYGTYQVNEFTGVPDISIPLYTVEAGGLQAPITLSYHASGNKVTDVASWVGLGFSVSAGGQCTRKTLGLPDDITYGYLNGYMWASSAIHTGTYAGVYYLEKVADGTYDTKPDIYSYDFPGHGGKFFFDGSACNGTYPVRMLPYAPLTVNYKMIPYSTVTPPPATGLTTFYITDEHGNNYTFGDAAVETTFSSTGGHPGSTIASAWKLEKMISQNRRDTVSFSYQADTINYPSADGEIYTVIDQITPMDTMGYSNASYSTAPTTPGNANVTAEELPQQITFKNGKVVFDLDSAVRTDINVGTGGYHAYGLKDIKVYQYNYGTKLMELQKTIVFYKSYFSPLLNPRLRLDSIQILDKAGAVMQHYRFDYNTSLTLPQYTSYQQDYWGYYNGKANNMFTPQQSVTWQPTYVNTITYVTIGSSILNGRNPDPDYMQAYILTGIHYPTGGYSTFTYQTNQYDTSGVVAYAGGLRISSISSYDGINPTPIVKSYVYNSARPNFWLDYDYFSTSQIHRLYTVYRDDWPKEVTTEVVRTYSSNPHCDLEAYDAAPVVYPSVTEYIGTAGTNAGRTDYTFTDQEDATLDASMAGNVIYLSSFYVRGHLVSKIDRINKSGVYQPVKAVFNTYTAFPYTNYNDVGLAVKKLYYNDGPAGTNPFEPGHASPDDAASFVYPYYYITSDDNYLTGTTEHIYDPNDSTKYTTSITTYKYDNISHQQVTRTYHTDSRGNTSVARTKFPADYSAGNAVIDSMVNRNMQAEPIEKYDTLKNVASGVNGVVSAQLNKYKVGGEGGYTIVPSTVSTLSVANPLTNFTPSTVSAGTLTSDSRYVQMISFDNYDTNNNLLQYTARNATPVSILWNYNYENPVAQVKNAANTYTGGYVNTFYTSFEADSKGNWFYSGTPVYSSTAPTGNLVYPLGSGNITSSSLSSAQSYVLSLWSNTSAPIVYNGSAYLTGVSSYSANGWTEYEYAVPTGSGSITISGSMNIDELRMYPSNAQMTTYAYDPSGLKSISDTKGANSYFDYDYLQRLKNIKDWAGNIVKNYGYHLYDMGVGNTVQTAVFTRNNCPPNTTPGSLSFTVPANRYYGTSLTSANADATYDMNLNGQIKANANCGCPITYISVQVNNTSGQASFPITFTGVAPYYVPTGTSYISVPENSSYSSVQVGPLGSGTYNFTMGTRPAQNGVHYATFTSVNITPGSSDLTLSIAP